MVQLKAIRWLVIVSTAPFMACESGTQDTGNGAHLTSPDGVKTPIQEPSLTPPPAEGGIWRGTDPEGHRYLLLAAPGASGTRISDLTMGYVGGELEVGNGYDEELGIGYAFWALPPLPEWDQYGWSLCILDAKWAARSPIDGFLSCAQLPDGDRLVSISLYYDEHYDLGADHSRLAGNWTDATDPGIDVININQSGQITGQHAATGCTYFGQASVIDPKFNIYDVEWTFGNCNGDEAALNEQRFSGLATVNNSGVPVTLTIAATGWAPPPEYGAEHRRGVGFVTTLRKY